MQCFLQSDPFKKNRFVRRSIIPRGCPFHIHTPPFTDHRKGDLFSDVKHRKNRRKSHRSTNDRLRSAALSPLVGYMRVSKADGSQVLDLQKDALTGAGVPDSNIYSDTASGKKDVPASTLVLKRCARAILLLSGSSIVSVAIFATWSTNDVTTRRRGRLARSASPSTPATYD
jgi:hypothetical protein